MSTTPYLTFDLVGAAAFTGTGAQTLLATPLDDISADTDEGDMFAFEVVAQLQNSTGSSQQLHLDMLADSTVVHRETIASIGSSVSARYLTASYKLWVIEPAVALITADVRLSGAGLVGDNPRYRSNPEDSATFDISGAIPIDFQVTLAANDIADLWCAGKLIFGHKVEPVLSSGAGATPAVVSVNGEDGVVVLTAADVGALAATLQPVVSVTYNTGTQRYGPRPTYAGIAEYFGPVEPTVANCTAPPFTAGTDLWTQLP